jgi:hypothetical protein
MKKSKCNKNQTINKPGAFVNRLSTAQVFLFGRDRQQASKRKQTAQTVNCRGIEKPL